MIVLKGKYNQAKVFTDTLDKETQLQIEHLLDQSFVEDSQIRIMPDTHAGAGSTIGTTITIKDKVVPHMVGVDIGCGIETLLLKDRLVELEKLDNAIHNLIPARFSVRNNPHEMAEEVAIENLKCKGQVKMNRAYLSIGTLGGGNHFIELAKDKDERIYLIIHTGSRNLGLQVADYYQRKAVLYQQKNSEKGRCLLVESLTNQRKEKEFQKKLKNLPLPEGMSKSLAWIEGEDMEDYLHDMAITQHYANINRKAIAKTIVKEMGFKVEKSFTTVHNYIDVEEKILRKGAISAKEGEEVLIPINMRDGSLLCVGKGNIDWNYSAPHGAGRIMSRKEAKETITLKAYKDSMKGIYSTTVGKATLDEAPYAYKPIEEIIKHVEPTVTIKQRLVPLYNFKAAE